MVAANRQRGFSLIELLVVIAVIALLTGLLLPALAAARRASQGVVGLANLHQLGMAQYVYAGDNKNTYCNPFVAPDFGPDNETGWATVNRVDGPNPGFPFSFQTEGYASLLFSAHWASLIINYLEAGPYNSGFSFSPLDKAVIQRFHDLKEEYNLWDGSYWLSPVFWTKSSLWQGTDPPRVDITAGSARAVLRRNRMDETPLPASKVLSWERFDFQRTSRPRGTEGREALCPNWNNPEASPAFVAVDGSTGRARIAAIRQEIDRLKATGEGLPALLPVGLWDVPDLALGDYLLSGDNLENGSTANPGAYEAFFWGTRDGVAGRDLIR